MTAADRPKVRAPGAYEMRLRGVGDPGSPPGYEKGIHAAVAGL